jgi:hypothetical protein
VKRNGLIPRTAGAVFLHSLLILITCGIAVAQKSSVDSLEIERLQTEIQRATLEVRRTDFLHRLTPRVTFTAAIGAQEMIFIDPSNGQTSLLPRDTYRLMVSLSLSDLFDTGSHESALLERNLKMLDLEFEKARQAQRRDEQLRRAEGLRIELAALMDQSDLYRRIERYYSILFEEGKVQFDALANARLRTLELSLRIARIRAELQTISEN